MAGFFEKFGEKVANVVGGASDALGDFAQESKLKMDIKKCEDRIKTLKTDFGIEAVEAKFAAKPETEIMDRLQVVCNEIRAVELEIEGLKAEIANIKKNSDENKEA